MKTKKIKKRLLTVSICFLCAFRLDVYAGVAPIETGTDGKELQQGNYGKTVTGKVSDVNGIPIAGASVRLKDQNIGTVTDVDGNYSLLFKTPPTAILISYIGYVGHSIKYTGQNVIDVVLSEDENLLNEVVVTGYQTISKERATGAFAIVNNEAIEKKINIDLTQALEGQVAGVTTYGGDVVIRGRSTISPNVGTKPLLVIDGLPTERNIEDININDVESMTILKDAAATSIYGSRAANGVLVITTKTAEKGKMQINFNADWKWTENPSLEDYNFASAATSVKFEQMFWERSAKNSNISVDQFAKNQNTAFGKTGAYVSPLLSQRIALANGEITQEQYDAEALRLSQNDFRQSYMDALWRTPLRQNYTLSVSNASDRQNTYASVTYTGDLKQIKSDNSDDMRLNLKTTQKVFKWLSVDLGIDALYGKSDVTDDFFSFGSQMFSLAAYNQIYDDNGGLYYLPYANNIAGASTWYATSTTAQYSPLRVNGMNALGVFESLNYNTKEEMEKHRIRTDNMFLRSYAKLNLQLTKDLKFSTSFDYEISQTDREREYDANSYLLRNMRNRLISKNPTSGTYVKNFPLGGYLEQTKTSKNNYTFRNQLDYNKTIEEKHSITALLGFEMREVSSPIGIQSKLFGYNPQTLSSTTATVLNPTLLASGVTSVLYGNNQTVQSTLLNAPSLTSTLNRYVSYYSAGGYTYNNLYNVSGSVRLDQTNFFGTDPKYRYRPLWSLGAGWNISNEDFMKSSSWIDMLTIRGSYGVTGNVDQTSTPYVTALVRNTTAITLDPMEQTTLASAPNPSLRWEKTSSYALGLDFSILKRKLNGKIEGYYKYSDDLLVSTTLPIATGYSSSIVNNGAMSNRGIEITLNSPWYNHNNLKLASTLVFAYNKNQVERVNQLATYADQLVTNSGSYYEEGKPYNAVYAYRYQGIKTDGTEAQNGIPVIVDKEGNPIYTIAPDGKSVKFPSDPRSVSTDDVVYLGTFDPKWSGSFTQSIEYKGIELSGMFTFYGGNKIRKPTYDYFISNPGLSANLSKYAEDGWTPENPDSSLPKCGVYNTLQVNAAGINIVDYWRYSDVNVVDGDMLRLRNLSLSYSLPQKTANTLKLNRVRLTAQANNLWMWSAAGNGIDPEVYRGSAPMSSATTLASTSNARTATAIDWRLPSMKSYLLRLEITF